MPRFKHPVLVFVLYGVLTLLLTAPTLHYITNNRWLADSVHDPDAYIKLWDLWFFDKIIAGEAQFYHTNTLFFPTGLDLTYHTFHIPQMLLAALVKPFIGLIGAFNLVALIFTWITAYSGYVLIRELLYPPSPPPSPSFGEGELQFVYAAFYGGCVFGFSQWVIHNFRHPDLSLLATQAWTLLFFIRACRTGRYRWAAVAGICLGLTAYMGMYLVVITLVMVGLYGVWQLLTLLVNRARYIAPPQIFLRHLNLWMIFLVVMGLIAAPRVLPMVSGNLNFVLTDKYAQYYAWESVDLISFFAPADHPILGELFDIPEDAQRYHMFYLGWIPLCLTLFALSRAESRRKMWFWFALLIFFMWLSLGTMLNINGISYPDVPMLKTLLDNLPVLFKSFGRPDTFQAGVVLPLSICAAYGLYEVLKFLAISHQPLAVSGQPSAHQPMRNHSQNPQPKPRSGRWTQRSAHSPQHFLKGGFVSACFIIFTLFELWTGAYPGKDVVAAVNPFYVQIAADNEDYALIQLPFGRNPGKHYLYLQTIHGKPIVEGLASRTPDGAYTYIENNALLTAWRFHQPLNCQTWDAAALEQLIVDNFRYVTLQKIYRERFPAWQSYVAHLAPVYEDARLIVYDMRDLAADPPCS